MIAVLLDRQEVTFIIPIAKLRMFCSGDSDKTRPYLEMVNGSRDGDRPRLKAESESFQTVPTSSLEPFSISRYGPVLGCEL